MINPSEISEILKQQLSDVQQKVSFEEVGTVLEVGDGVAHVYGLDNVEANELVEFENGVTGVAMNLEESNVGVILMDKVDSVKEGMKVTRRLLYWKKIFWPVMSSSLGFMALSLSSDFMRTPYSCEMLWSVSPFFAT